MNEPELRALVRDVIARRASAGVGSSGVSSPDMMRVVRQHSSHATFVLPTGTDTDGPCLIEAAVTCNHCGYCKSYGH
jgi:hypothetical protein